MNPTEDQLEAERLADDEATNHAGCLDLRTAAGALHLSTEAVRTMLARHELGHPDPRWAGKRPRLHVTFEDLAIAYPRYVTFRSAPPRRRRLIPLNEHAVRYPDTIPVGTAGSRPPEFEAAKKRMRDHS